MAWRARLNEKGQITRYSDSDTGQVISVAEYERRLQMQQGGYSGYAVYPGPSIGTGAATGLPAYSGYGQMSPQTPVHLNPETGRVVPQTQPLASGNSGLYSQSPNALSPYAQSPMALSNGASPYPQPEMAGSYAQNMPVVPGNALSPNSPLIQPGAQILTPGAGGNQPMAASSNSGSNLANPTQGTPPTTGMAIQSKNLRLEGNPLHVMDNPSAGYKPHGFLDATSIAILLPTLVLLTLVIAAAHKKRLFPWQTVRVFNPPSGLMSLKEYERSFVCPPNMRKHGRLGKQNPNATWTDEDGIVIPFGFLARTHLPVTLPLGRLPNKNMFLVAPSGSGKTTLMRAIIKGLLAKPCVIIALEAKANDPNLDEKKEGFKYTVLPEAQQAGFESLYFNPLDLEESIHWNPLDLSPITFASSIVQDINSLEAEDQHWAERDHGYIAGLAQLLKWGAVQVVGEDENAVATQVASLPCNPRGLMRLVNNRRNIVESLRRLKNNPDVDVAELTELTQTLSSIIRTDTDWDKNIQGVRGRLRMFKNPNVLRVTETSNIDLRASMHKPTVLIFGAPASLGPDAESLASCFVYQLQQALHTRYGTVSVLPLFALFDEYQTLNMDIAGRLSAIVRGANGGLTVILQNISQISTNPGSSGDPGKAGTSELKTIFSNSAVRICLHNADETTAKFFSEEIGKHAVMIPGVSDRYQAGNFSLFPVQWQRLHSQQVVQRVDPDAIKRMDKFNALVYLTPAGDPEFGETKPFMVDLRGIEEIARLHLMHNVSARRMPPGSTPPGSMPGNMPGTPGGDFPGAPGGAFPGNVPDIGGRPSAQSPTPPYSPKGPIPTGAGALAGYQSTPLEGAQTQAMKSRFCTACGQKAGNKKFCIHCGNLLGGTSNGESQPSNGDSSGESTPKVSLETSAAIINAQKPNALNRVASQPFPYGTENPAPAAMPLRTALLPARKSPLTLGASEIAEAAQQAYALPRTPVTSLVPDADKLGLPQSPASNQNNDVAQANSQPVSNTRRDIGLEF